MRARDIDYAIGVPLVLALGATRTKRRIPEAPRRIGLIKTRAIGDAILCSVLTKAIRLKWPECHLILFADENTKAIAAMIPAIDEIVVLSPKRPWRSVLPLRRAGLDLLFDLGSWPRIDALFAAIAQTRFRIGFETQGQHRHYAYDLTVKHRSDVHEVENYLALLAAITPHFLVQDRLPSVKPESIYAETAKRLQPFDFSQRYVVFHPWAGGSNPRAREWREQNWLELGRHVLDAGLSIVISGGPSDAQASARLSERLAEGGGAQAPVTCLAGKARLGDMYWVLQRAAAVVAVNTGTMHLAAATGTPVIGLHGPTNPKRWGPLGLRANAIFPAEPDCGFLNLGFEYKGQPHDCMARISAAPVWEALCAILKPGSSSSCADL